MTTLQKFDKITRPNNDFQQMVMGTITRLEVLDR